jgi:hypothetical protein
MRSQEYKKMQGSRETADRTVRDISMHVAASAIGVARVYIASGRFGTTSLIKS